MNDFLRNYLVFGIVVLVLILVFILIRMFIVKYFKVQTIKARSMSYPMVLALTLLFTGFMAVNSMGSYLLDVLVKILNEKFHLQVSPPNWIQSLSTFVVFATAIVALIYVYYNKYKKEQTELEKNRLKYEGENRREIIVPPDLPGESMIFHERIKNLFHLKDAEKGLDLKYDGKLKVLFGEYVVGFRKYQIVVFCKSNEMPESISSDQITKVYKELESCREDFLGPMTATTLADYYFLIEHGTFENSSMPIHCFSEEGFLNKYIDFTPYLRTFVQKFETDKLPFSNVDSALFNNTLAGTFVQPKFNGGQENLPGFLDGWLKEDSQRHIALLGDYGTGKTSFLKYYVYSLAKKILNRESFDRFPVFISLTRTSPMHGGIKSSIADFLVNNKLEVNYQWFVML